MRKGTLFFARGGPTNYPTTKNGVITSIQSNVWIIQKGSISMEISVRVFFPALHNKLRETNQMFIQGLVQYLNLKLMLINLMGKRVQRVKHASHYSPSLDHWPWRLKWPETRFHWFFRFSLLSNPYLYNFKFALSFSFSFSFPLYFFFLPFDKLPLY